MRPIIGSIILFFFLITFVYSISLRTENKNSRIAENRSPLPEIEEIDEKMESTVPVLNSGSKENKNKSSKRPEPPRKGASSTRSGSSFNPFRI